VWVGIATGSELFTGAGAATADVVGSEAGTLALGSATEADVSTNVLEVRTVVGAALFTGTTATLVVGSFAGTEDAMLIAVDTAEVAAAAAEVLATTVVGFAAEEEGATGVGEATCLLDEGAAAVDPSGQKVISKLTSFVWQATWTHVSSGWKNAVLQSSVKQVAPWPSQPL